MKTTIFQPENGKYHLYLECIFAGKNSIYVCGEKYHHRFFRTIKDALDYIDAKEINVFSSNFLWRLERTTDGKNFTNKIYTF